MNAQIKACFRINPLPASLSDEVVRRAAGIPTPNISDGLGKLYPASVSLKPMHRVTKRMAGRAITVRVPPGDNFLVHKGIAYAEPGDVLVVDAGGVTEQAIVGEIMTVWAQKRGLAGVVIFGAIRDIDIVGSSDFPVYACGYTARGPFRDSPGEINIDISVGGLLVSPGDLVVGDQNGIVSIPHSDIERVLESAGAIKDREDKLVAAIRQDAYDFSWIDQTLRERGYTL